MFSEMATRHRLCPSFPLASTPGSHFPERGLHHAFTAGPELPQTSYLVKNSPGHARCDFGAFGRAWPEMDGIDNWRVVVACRI